MDLTNVRIILVFTMPAMGHINPLNCILSKLSKQGNFKIIVYATDEVRSVFEKTGVEYRSYANFPLRELMIRANTGKFSFGDMLNLMLGCAISNLDAFIGLVEKDEPDLIIYDELALYAKLLMEVLKKRQRDGISIPAAIMFRPHFASQNDIYPNKTEAALFKQTFKLTDMLALIVPLVKTVYINLKYGLWNFNIFGMIFNYKENVMINTIAPAIQPRSHLFNKADHFVGACIDENVRNEVLDQKLQSFLDLFAPINPISAEEREENNRMNKLRLVFVSFGTVMNSQMNAYVKIIDAARQIHGSDNYRFVIATGGSVKSQLDDQISKGQLSLPHNVVLAAYAPQLEILKRASLFISHCGMNSTSETVNYAVPLICLPIRADQPRNAYRIADELGCGIRLNLDTFTVDQLINAIETVLGDMSYYDRVYRLALASRKYDGVANSCKLILNVIEERKKSSVQKKNN